MSITTKAPAVAASFSFSSPSEAHFRTLLLLMTFGQTMLRMTLQSFLILWWRLDNVVMGTEMLKNRQTDSEIRLDTEVI